MPRGVYDHFKTRGVGHPNWIPREIRFCECGCGETFECKTNSKKRYINGHSRKAPREIRICECGCSGTFECKASSKQKYLQGHSNRGKHINQPNKILRETRYCACGCGGTFECLATSKQKYIYGHYWRGRKRPLDQIENIRAGTEKYYEDPKNHEKQSVRMKEAMNCTEVKERCSRSKKKNWEDLEYREKQFKAIIEGSKLLPNKPEKFLDKLFQKLFPNQIKYVGDGKDKDSFIGGRCPDFIFIDGQKKIIEHFGDYHHGEGVTGIPNEQHEQERTAYFAKYGYQTLIIWEHELDNTSQLRDGLVEFCA